MKALSLIIIAAIAASPTWAADLPNRAAPPVYVPPIIPVTWTGCYVGGFGGVDIAHVENDPSDSRSNQFETRDRGASTTTRASTSTTATTVATTQVPTRGVEGGPEVRNRNVRTTRTTTVTTTTVRTPTVVRILNARAGNDTSYGRTFVGGDGGGRVGCNYQAGRFVVGAQLEGGYLGINGTTYDPARRTTASALGGGAYGAVTGRIGYAVFDRTLVYARGGVGYADLKFSTFDPALGYSNAVHGSQAMPLVGAGIEYKLTPQVSVTGEYTYLRPGCRTIGYAFSGAAGGGGTSTTCVDKHMIALGLNYYFTPVAAPVVARY